MKSWTSLAISGSFWILGTMDALGGEVPEVSTASVISIPYPELMRSFGRSVNKEEEEEDSCPPHLLTAIAEAFGPEGLGFVEISDIPEDMVALRRKVLEMAPQLATLSPDELEALTLPETSYTIGWSHGKEQFGKTKNGEPIYDTRKGSFYLDPFRELNVFPSKALPDLEADLLQITRWMSETTLWVSQLCDIYLATAATNRNNQAIGESTIHSSLSSRVNTKARLLYYFPTSTDAITNDEDGSTKDDWCGWHKDHGSLTALLPGHLFGNNDSNHLDSSSKSPSPKAGLYIRTTESHQTQGIDSAQPTDIFHVRLPPTSIGIQVGETLEIMSGGLLRATPHAVMSGKNAGSKMQGNSSDTSGGGRASLAVFLQPEPHQMLPDCPPTGDASLKDRHRPTFGEFQEATTKAFQ